MPVLIVVLQTHDAAVNPDQLWLESNFPIIQIKKRYTKLCNIINRR